MESARPRTATEKGLSYRKEQLFEKKKRTWKSLEKQITDILGLLQVSGELIVDEPKQRQVEELLAEYDEVSAACKNLLSEKRVSEWVVS